MILSFVFLSQVQAKNSIICARYYTSLVSRAWLAAEAAKARDYIRGTKDERAQEAAVEKILKDIFDSPRDIISPLDVDTFTIRIVDQGLDSHKPVEVVMTDKSTKVETVLLSSLKLEELRLKESEKRPEYAPTVNDYLNDNTVIPVWAQLSPKRDILLVKVSGMGSIDGHTLVAIDLKSKKILQEIDNVDPNETVWITPTSFTFKTHVVGKPIHTATLGPKGVFEITKTPDVKVNGSADQQWYFLRSKTGNRIVNAISGATVEVPNLSGVESITPDLTDKSILWVKTQGRAGFSDIQKIKTNSPNPRAETIIAEREVVIEDFVVQKDKIRLTTYLGADRWVEFTDLNGKPMAHVRAPDCCSLSGAKFNMEDQIVEMNLASPVVKATKWFYDLKNNKWLKENAAKERVEGNPSIDMLTDNGVKYVSEFRSFKSKDGTEIPIRVTYKEGTKMDGNNGALMEGYGGFALNNYFHPTYERMTHEYLKAGKVYLAPALRGSYFFGKDWHDQGRALNKQNVIDDFIGAAEWAIAQGLTSAKLLAISGASHGGLLVGAAITQRPELFGLAFPQFGPHLFSQKATYDPITTPLQVFEYGDLINDPVAIANAKKIDPYENAVPQNYPFTVVMTGWYDTRVNPDHSIEFFKRLKANQTGDQPIHLFSLNNSGHWMSSIPRQDFIGWRARVTFWSILFKYNNIEL